MDAGDRRDTSRRAGTTPEERLEQFTSTIQASGGNILVTGELSQEAATVASRQMLGDADKTRKRLLALTDSGIEDPHAFLPGDITTDHHDVWFIDQRDTHRSISAIPEVADTDLPSPTAGTDLDVLRRDITEAISGFARTADLAPCDLRLVVDSLTISVKETGPDAVAHALRQILPLVAAHDGIGHYFLLGTPDAEYVERLRPLFDAHLELQNRQDSPVEHRWHFPDFDQPTQWLTFTSD